MHEVHRLILEAIEAQDPSRPRSLQREVGPSDLGDPCDHCLAAKLAGWEKRPEMAWLPYIGTAVHAQLAQAFERPEWWTEVETEVGLVGTRWVHGTADLFHVPTRTVVDFKIVGVKTLRDAKAGRVSEKYQRQVHLYGRGLQAHHVAIAFLPRSAPDLGHAVYWSEPYDPNIVVDTLDRADRLVGVDVSKQARAEGCYDCPRFDDWDAYCNSLLVGRPLTSIMERIME